MASFVTGYLRNRIDSDASSCSIYSRRLDWSEGHTMFFYSVASLNIPYDHHSHLHSCCVYILHPRIFAIPLKAFINVSEMYKESGWSTN